MHVSAPTENNLRVVVLDETPPELRELLTVLRWLVPGASFGTLVAILVARALRSERAA